MGSRSQFLSDREVGALLTIGDIMIPANAPFPSFSQRGCIAFVDDLLRYLDTADKADLRLLLGLFSRLPSPLIRLFLHVLSIHVLLPNFLAGFLRHIQMGIRGLIWSLYYSNKTSDDYTGPRPLEIIGFDLPTPTTGDGVKDQQP